MTRIAEPSPTPVVTMAAAVRLVLWVHESLPGGVPREYRTLEAHLNALVVRGAPLTLTPEQARAVAVALDLVELRPQAVIMANLTHDLRPHLVGRARAALGSAVAPTYTLDQLTGGAA